MARVTQCGWETGDVQQIGASVVQVTSTLAIATSTPSPRSGTYYMKATLPSGAGTNYAYLTVAHATKTTEVWHSFGIYATSPGPSAADVTQIFALHDSAGNKNLMITYEAGTIRAYRANAGGASPSWSSQFTLLGSGSVSLSLNAWHLMEVRYIPSATTGTTEVWLDGTRIINVTTGSNVQTNANTAVAYLGTSGTSRTSGSAACTFSYDDYRMNDTTGSTNTGQPGDEAIRLLVPNAAGDSTQFSRGGTDSGANWSQVEEVPPTGTTDYVYSSTSGQMDLYNLTTLAVSTISAISVIVQGFNSDGAGGGMYLVTKTAAGQSDGSAQPISGSAALYQRVLDTDPADSAAWDQTKLDALQVGVKVV